MISLLSLMCLTFTVRETFEVETFILKGTIYWNIRFSYFHHQKEPCIYQSSRESLNNYCSRECQIRISVRISHRSSTVNHKTIVPCNKFPIDICMYFYSANVQCIKICFQVAPSLFHRSIAGTSD